MLEGAVAAKDLVLADTEGLDSPVVRRVEVAQRNAERLLALVSDLLMSASAAWLASNPGGMPPATRKLLMNSPAPIRATTASAISEVTSKPRSFLE